MEGKFYIRDKKTDKLIQEVVGYGAFERAEEEAALYMEQHPLEKVYVSEK